MAEWNFIRLADGHIYIPACNNEWANIAVCADRQTHNEGFHSVSLPDLARTDKAPVYYNEMPVAEYDRILQENRGVILCRVADLNRRIRYVGHTLVIDDTNPFGARSAGIAIDRK